MDKQYAVQLLNRAGGWTTVETALTQAEAERRMKTFYPLTSDTRKRVKKLETKR